MLFTKSQDKVYCKDKDTVNITTTVFSQVPFPSPPRKKKSVSLSLGGSGDSLSA